MMKTFYTKYLAIFIFLLLAQGTHASDSAVPIAFNDSVPELKGVEWKKEVSANGFSSTADIKGTIALSSADRETLKYCIISVKDGYERMASSTPSQQFQIRLGTDSDYAFDHDVSSEKTVTYELKTPTRSVSVNGNMKNVRGANRGHGNIKITCFTRKPEDIIINKVTYDADKAKKISEDESIIVSQTSINNTSPTDKLQQEATFTYQETKKLFWENNFTYTESFSFSYGYEIGIKDVSKHNFNFGVAASFLQGFKKGEEESVSKTSTSKTLVELPPNTSKTIYLTQTKCRYDIPYTLEGHEVHIKDNGEVSINKITLQGTLKFNDAFNTQVLVRDGGKNENLRDGTPLHKDNTVKVLQNLPSLF